MIIGAISSGYATEALPKTKFLNPPDASTSEGHVSLKWQADRKGVQYELQQSDNPQFTDPVRLYLGADSSSFLSGLIDGRYFFRVRARHLKDGAWGSWSTPIQLACKHHSMSLAWTLFATGGLLFLSIAVFVGVNALRLRRFEVGHA